MSPNIFSCFMLSRMFLVVLAGLPSFFATTGLAASGAFDVKVPSLKERLSAQVQIVQDSLGRIDVKQYDTNSPEAIDKLITAIDLEKGIRQALTDLQNSLLIWVKIDMFITLKPFKKEAKAFEDLISHMKDRKGFYDKALKAKNGTEEEYKTQLDAEFVKYTNFIQTSSWFKIGEESFKYKLEAELDRLKKAKLLPSPVKERDLVLNGFAEFLGALDQKQYNFNDVEKGIHELRRDLRRFSDLSDGYKGLLKVDATTCPFPESGGTHPAQVTRQYACPVSECLTLKLGIESKNLAGIKGQAASSMATGNAVSRELIEGAERIYKTIKQIKVLNLIQDQLRACMKAKVGG
jgi:hypothetical protein